jgi:glycosyltransferase involved in cell wall biosynthesis
LNKNSLHIWMNIPSSYQNDLFNSLCKKIDEFEVIYAHEQDLLRKKQGWNFELEQNYKKRIIGKNLKVSQLVQYVFQNRKSTHIVNGIWAEKYFFLVIILLNLFRANFLIYSEAPAPTKKRSFFKKSLLNFIIKPISKLLIHRAKGFLAVSIFAKEYFESLGVKSEKIYQFGYFRNISKPDFIKRESTINRIVFVGQLIERKGVLTLLDSIKKLAKITQNFHLDIIGDGILKIQIIQYIQAYHLENFVTLQGVVNSENIAQSIQKADMLVLPSIFDGWGIVINEALQSHVPVLISDRCGAKELIQHEQNGLIFEAQNVESLTEQLLKFSQFTLEEKNGMKSKVIETSNKIEINGVAEYLVDCLNHANSLTLEKPSAPWLL